MSWEDGNEEVNVEYLVEDETEKALLLSLLLTDGTYMDAEWFPKSTIREGGIKRWILEQKNIDVDDLEISE